MSLKDLQTPSLNGMTHNPKSSRIDQMSDEPISESVRGFIIENIDSVAELEALLLLRRESRVEWSVDALAERLYTSSKQAEEAIVKLHLLGLSALKKGSPRTYLYEPASPELDAVVAEVAETYSKYLVPVTNLIHSKPQSKVQQFADAFKLRGRRNK